VSYNGAQETVIWEDTVYQENKQFTPYGVLGVALLVVTLFTLILVYIDWTNARDAKMLDYMKENPAEVQQWLRDNEGK
jgi:hypothetical protein